MKTYIIATLFLAGLVTACSSGSSKEQAEQEAVEQTVNEANRLDSLSSEIEKTTVEIKDDIQKLDDVLKEIE